MSEIPEIFINKLEVIPINSYIHTPRQSLPQAPPVTLQIGNPIIQVPGCVVFNPANEKSINLVNEDARGNRVLCDGTVALGGCSNRGHFGDPGILWKIW